MRRVDVPVRKHHRRKGATPAGHVEDPRNGVGLSPAASGGRGFDRSRRMTCTRASAPARRRGATGHPGAAARPDPARRLAEHSACSPAPRHRVPFLPTRLAPSPSAGFSEEVVSQGCSGNPWETSRPRHPTRWPGSSALHPTTRTALTASAVRTRHRTRIGPPGRRLPFTVAARIAPSAVSVGPVLGTRQAPFRAEVVATLRGHRTVATWPAAARSGRPPSS